VTNKPTERKLISANLLTDELRLWVYNSNMEVLFVFRVRCNFYYILKVAFILFERGAIFDGHRAAILMSARCKGRPFIRISRVELVSHRAAWIQIISCHDPIVLPQLTMGLWGIWFIHHCYGGPTLLCPEALVWKGINFHSVKNYSTQP
jgi:hypothetical protein